MTTTDNKALAERCLTDATFLEGHIGDTLREAAAALTCEHKGHKGTNSEIQAVLNEMRERKINHGTSTSLTLHAWADRIEKALAV